MTATVKTNLVIKTTISALTHPNCLKVSILSGERERERES